MPGLVPPLWPCWGITRQCLTLTTVSGPDPDPDLLFHILVPCWCGSCFHLPSYCAWLTRESACPHWSLAHPTRFWLCPHVLFLSGPYSRTPVISSPLLKANSYNTHFLSKYYTIDFICAFSNISLNRKKKSGERIFCP